MLQPKRKKRIGNARHGADNDQDQESDLEGPNPPVVEQVGHEESEEHEVDEGDQALQDLGEISDQLDAFNLPQPPPPEEDEDPIVENAVPAAPANAPPAQLEPQRLDVEQSIRHENSIRPLVGKLLWQWNNSTFHLPSIFSYTRSCCDFNYSYQAFMSGPL